MSKVKFFIFCGSVVINSCMFLYAQEVTVSLSKDKAYVGDIVEFVVKADLPKNTQISAFQNFRLDDFEILSTNIRRLPFDNNNSYELKFKISSYKTGNLTIKPLTVFYINPDGTNNLFFTPEKSIHIQSLIVDPKSAEIKDIKSLKKLKIKSGFIVLIVVVLFFIVMLAIYILKDIKEERKKSKIILLNERMLALNNLNDLYQNRTNITTRNFYYKMSKILRTYISKQYKFDAMEMTTSEFFEKTKEFLPAEVNVNEFKNYLKIFNLVRYADFTPNEKEIENNYIFTKKLLELI